MDQTSSIDQQRSELIQDIVARMPTRFSFWVTGLIIVLVTLLLLFGWIIDYPDIVSGTITISAKYSPIKLVANSPGKITILNVRTKDNVKEGEYIAVIQNPANTIDVLKLDTLLNSFDIRTNDLSKIYKSFPTKLSLGEVNAKYYAFLNALQQNYNYKEQNIFEEQERGYKDVIQKLTGILANDKNLKTTKENNLHLSKKIADRDSILLAEKVADEDDADHSKITYLNSKESYQNIGNDIINIEQQIGDNKSKLEQLYTQRNDKEKQMQLDILSASNDLKDNLKAWEQHFVFKSPMAGKVEFLKFWSSNQFIQSGEEVFTIIPKENKMVGKMVLPSRGAGKVKPGQNVVIKLDNYPYEEYGYIHGVVSSISLTTNEVKAPNQNIIDTYLVEVNLPKGLVTNYGSKLDFKYEIKGSADIISKQRQLLERFFDNLKYTVDKN